MSNDEELQNSLLAIHSRLGVIEGKVNLVARADRGALLQLLEETVRKRPLIGQIYLLLDGTRTQTEIQKTLAEYGIEASQPTVSRRMNEMETEHGIADLIEGGATKVYAKDREMEKVLNLSKNVRKWLTDANQTIPEQQVRRSRKRHDRHNS